MKNLTRFVWPRATGRGYIWQTLPVREGQLGKALKDTRILTFPAPGESTVFETIAPLSINDALLWRLATTELNEASITAFANSFGLLVGNHYGAPGGRGLAYSGDTYEVWVNEISDAKLAVDLYSAIRLADRLTLSNLVKWSAQKQSVRLVLRDYRQGSALIAGPEHHPEELAYFEPGDVIMPAQFYLMRLVNRQLEKYISPQLVWSTDQERSGLYLCPKNLLGAMWVQFSEIIDQRKTIASCEACGVWFERARKDKRHCSDSCRVRAMRSRKEGKK